MERIGRYLFAVAMMIWAVADCAAASVRLDVQSGRGRREISVGDLFYITYQITNSDSRPEKPASVPGAKVMYFDLTGQSSSFSSVNGKTSQSISYTYTLTLRAQKEGTFSFGPVVVGGVKSNEVSYIIGKGELANQNATTGSSGGVSQGMAEDQPGPKFIGKGDGNLFLKANISKASSFEQEALVYTVKLYTTYDAIKFIGATSAPKFEGFVVEESKDVSNQLAFETYNGKTYATAIIARYIIFPQMPGKLKVIGNKYTVSVDEREYYHDPFWGNMSVAKPLQLNVTPNDLTVDVKPLPLPKPADFSGGVGDFSITSSLPEQKFMSSQAASIVYTVKGTGNIKYVNLPDLNSLYPPELEVYSPSPDVQVNVGSNNVSGTVRFDYSFMPLEEGEFSIPEVKLVYFNPSTGKYETSGARGYDITVGKGKGSAKSQTKGNRTFDSGLMSVGKLSRGHTLWVYSVWYWIMFLLPVLLLAGSSAYYRAYLKANSDFLAVKSRKASKMARKRFKKAESCMKRNDTSRFYDEMLAALWGYLGDKLKMPVSELTRDNVREVLETRGVGEEDVKSVLGVLDDCEFAKYAPGDSHANMERVYDEGVGAINTLEGEFSKKGKNEIHEV